MKEKILHKDDKQRSGSETGSLILYNDDINTFEHVIKSLVEVCGQNPLQAEQCAFIIHHNGKCGVKKGSLDDLKPFCLALLDKGLSASID